MCISTTSPSATVWSSPNFCPPNFAEFPQTFEYLNFFTKSRCSFVHTSLMVDSIFIISGAFRSAFFRDSFVYILINFSF